MTIIKREAIDLLDHYYGYCYAIIEVMPKIKTEHSIIFPFSIAMRYSVESNDNLPTICNDIIDNYKNIGIDELVKNSS